MSKPSIISIMRRKVEDIRVHIRRRWREQLPAYLTVGLVFGIVGTLLLWGTHALTPSSSTDVANGTFGNCASHVTDTTANSGAGIKFGSNTTDPSCLDASGASIIDTAYLAGSCDVVANSSCPNTIFMSPSGLDTNAGTKAAPVKTIRQAVTLVPAGGYIVARGGTYRDWYMNGSNTGFGIVGKALTLQAYPHEKVWFDGSDVATGWTSDGSGHWTKTWATPTFCSGHYYDLAYNNQDSSASNTGPCTHYDQYGATTANYPAAGDPQMVFKDGARIAEVDTLAGVTSSSFFYQQDLTNKTGTIYLGFDPTGHTVELAARPTFMVVGISNFTARGVGFRKFATNEYPGGNTDGALYIGGTGSDTIENDTFTQMAGQAMHIYPANTVVNHSIFAFNGFNGLGSNGSSQSATGDSTISDGLQIINSVFNNNNLEHYGNICSASCAAAGVKTAHLDGFTVKNNIFENTVGNGHNGTGTGFWCDTDCNTGVIVNNFFNNNTADGAAYEVDDTGIIAGNLFVGNKTGISANATNTKIYNNTIVDTGATQFALRLYSDSRRAPSNVSFLNNIIYGSSQNTIYMAKELGGTVYPSSFISGSDYNSFWFTSQCNGTNCVQYRWDDTTGIKFYESSAAFHTAFPSFAANSTDSFTASDPFFTNSATGDYSIRTGTPVYHSAAALPSDVAAALGLTTAAGQNRGATWWPGNE